MVTPRQRLRFGDDRGAMLAYAAIAIVVLLAISTFVADYGVLWASRRQAQNSADAAALAGAIGLAFNDPSDLTDTGPARAGAFLTSQKNFVWGAAPSVFTSSDITIVPCPDGGANCIRVDVYRNAQRRNALPMFFGYFVGLTTQDIRATATAEVQIANATDCLKPWAVIDKWDEHWPKPVVPWDPGPPSTSSDPSTFDKYTKQGDLDTTVTDPDVYVAPTEDDFGTGFHPFESDGKTYHTPDYGLELALKVGGQNDFNFATGWFAALALFDSKGGSDYGYNIKHCIGVTYTIGDQLPINTEPGEKVGPTAQATQTDTDSLVLQDPDAHWDSTLNGGHGGVAGSAYGVSPRIVAIPLVNPDEMALAQKGGRTSVTLGNIMGFFVEGYDTGTKSVYGRLMTMPGKYVAGAPKGTSSFLKTVTLVR